MMGMPNLRKTLGSLCIGFVVFTQPIHSQDRPAVNNSNYAGTLGVDLNPASMIDSRLWLDVHLAGLNAFVHNNYAYYPDSRTYDLLKGVDGNRIGFNRNHFKRHGFSDVTVHGPAVMLSLNKHAFGIATSVSSYTHIANVPDEWLDVFQNGYTWASDLVGDHTWRNISVKHLTWGETSISYAHMFKVDRVHMFSGGLTVKRLFGINSANLNLRELSGTMDHENTVMLHKIDGDYSYVEPDRMVGKGWGVSIGINYRRALNDANYEYYTPHVQNWKCKGMKYRYKFGLSLVDFGSITIDRNATLYTYKRDFTTENNIDSLAIQISDSPTKLAETIFEDANLSDPETAWKAWLPTAVSGQFDYYLEYYNIYFNATIIQRWGRKRMNGTERANILTLTPRYETRHFEASLPLTLLEYRYPLPGVALRYRFLTLGTDNLTPWVYKKNLYRSDVYFHLRIPVASKRGCKEVPEKVRKSRKPDRKYLKDKVTKCPTFKKG